MICLFWRRMRAGGKKLESQLHSWLMSKWWFEIPNFNQFSASCLLSPSWNAGEKNIAENPEKKVWKSFIRRRYFSQKNPRKKEMDPNFNSRFSKFFQKFFNSCAKLCGISTIIVEASHKSLKQGRSTKNSIPKLSLHLYSYF